MKRLIIIAALVSCLILAGPHAVVTAAEAVFEPIPEHLQEPVEGSEFQDDAFFKIADPVVKLLSNRTVPTGTQRMKVSSAYMSLKGMSVSPENYEVAKATLEYLYYSGKAGEAYEDYFSQKKSVAAMTDGSEFYELVDVYHMTASNWFALITGRYPNATPFILPAKDDPFPEEASGSGILLDGLKYPMNLVQKEPNPDKPYQDEEVVTTVERWIEDNLDTIPNQSDLQGMSQGLYFMTSDGPRWAKSTYMSISSKNVNPDFYDTANYINAFMHYLAQARDYYDEYISERTNLLLISDGQDNYDMAKSYYDDAGVAFTKFIDQLPAVNNTTTLPTFPTFDEISRGRQTEYDKMQGGDDSAWGGSSWGGGSNFN
jgi:hypothetical protein